MKYCKHKHFIFLNSTLQIHFHTIMFSKQVVSEGFDLMTCDEPVFLLHVCVRECVWGAIDPSFAVRSGGLNTES